MLFNAISFDYANCVEACISMSIFGTGLHEMILTFEYYQKWGFA